MKKTWIILLCITMVLSLAACGKKGPEFNTLADCMAAPYERCMDMVDGENYVYVFFDNKEDGTRIPYRVTAEMTQEIYEQYLGLDFFDENYNDEVIKLIGGQKITQVEDLSSKIPTQKSLDEWVGKKGQEMMDAGYEVSGFGWGGGDDAEITVEKGLFEFTVLVDATDDFADEDFSGMDAFPDMTIRGISWSGMSTMCTDLSVTD
ncbi:MAG: hypothetical protein K6A77_01825 [Clostridiales bacterium]|nr:hypothetical protein [Clostridiales bacterium]